MTAEVEYRRVRLIGIPVDRWGRTRSWFEGLIRELDIIAAESTDSAPRDLVRFVADVRERFGRFSAGSNAILEEALRRGDAFVDLEMQLPPDAVTAARELRVRISAADDFCRQGELLTLALSDDLRAFIEWYLDEIADQIGGNDPRPWNGDELPLRQSHRRREEA